MDPATMTLFIIVGGGYCLFWGIPCLCEIIRCSWELTKILFALLWFLSLLCIFPIILLLGIFSGISFFEKAMKAVFNPCVNFMEKAFEQDDETKEEVQEEVPQQTLVRRYEIYKAVMEDKNNKYYFK